jgi:ATP-dependent helicase/nuclease subunit A
MRLGNLQDQAARDLAEKALDRSLLVEASAGTGKTSVLVARIVNIVLEQGTLLTRIAALTFTEKAAAEMKTRVRTALDQAIQNAADARDELRLERARGALRDLDAAEITTLHSFCSRLLRDRPVEADVDPDFSSPDESIGSELLAEAFEGWVAREASLPHGPLVDALRNGASYEGIKILAEELYGQRLLLGTASLPTDSLGEIRREIPPLVDELDLLLNLFPRGAADPSDKAEKLRAARAELAGLLNADLAAFASFVPAKKIEMRGKWPEDVKAQAPTFQEGIKSFLKRCAQLPFQPLLVALLNAFESDLFARVDEIKRERGLLDFDDLLLTARDLLRRSLPAREYFRERFQTFVVDEFQDTDPIQAEIVLRLAAGEPQDPEAWEGLRARKRALFLVGDPKQSIYRFRRADIETYRTTATQFEDADRVPLLVNFRSTPQILSFVNAAMEPVLTATAPWEVGYSPVIPPVRLGTPVSDGPDVLFLLPPDDVDPEEVAEAPADEDSMEIKRARQEVAVDRQEAIAVARLLKSRFQTGERPWSRIGVLVYKNATVATYQEVFREAGIPVVLDGGQSFFQREETAAVIAALRALDDPDDTVSTVAALKSFLFGITDPELLDVVESGGRLSEWTTVPASSPVGAALGLLMRLRGIRHERPLAETLTDLLSSRMSWTALAHGAVVNGTQGLANVERLLVLARGLDAEGCSFRKGVKRLVRRLEENHAEPRAFEEGDDAVRLMTLHKAKGLEFDVVVVAELARKNPNDKRTPGTTCYDRAGGQWGAALNFGDVAVGTPGYPRLEADADLRIRAEARRLLYVALTRARQKLIVSWYRKKGVKKNGDPIDALTRSVLGPMAFAESSDWIGSRFVERIAANSAEPEAAADSSSASRASAASAARFVPIDIEGERSGIERRRMDVKRTASRPLQRAGEEAHAPEAELFSPEDSASIDRPARAEHADRADLTRSRALEVGVAVHASMETLLRPETGSRRPSAEAVTRAIRKAASDLLPEQLSEVTRLVGRLMNDPVFGQALAAPRRFVELPLLFRDGEGADAPLVEGKIDLLIEEEDGFTIVDWKTDRLDQPAGRLRCEELYAPQLAAYERGLRAALGPGTRLKAARLVFARPAL